jgi:hypothetical protein
VTLRLLWGLLAADLKERKVPVTGGALVSNMHRPAEVFDAVSELSRQQVRPARHQVDITKRLCFDRSCNYHRSKRENSRLRALIAKSIQAECASQISRKVRIVVVSTMIVIKLPAAGWRNWRGLRKSAEKRPKGAINSVASILIR